MWAPAKRLLFPLLLVVLLFAVAVAASRYASVDWLVKHDTSLRNQIQTHPLTACLVGFLVYLLLSLVPGPAGKSIILGWLYGLLAGVVIVNLALVLAAVVTFIASRHFLQGFVQARLGQRLEPVQRRMQQDGIFYLLTLRLAHVPYSLVNHAAAAGTDVPLRTFWWTTQLGLLPGNIVFVYAGTRLPTLAELVRIGPLGVLDGPMLVALLSSVLAPWLVRKLFHIALPGRRAVRSSP